ncbi:hypothetical protein NM962_15370 [Mycobacterium sp. SVM_VP21]|nr:hypothetical protein NM962_15370 [Mycobacterium sp. SVM_VP21]
MTTATRTWATPTAVAGIAVVCAGLIVVTPVPRPDIERAKVTLTAAADLLDLASLTDVVADNPGGLLGLDDLTGELAGSPLGGAAEDTLWWQSLLSSVLLLFPEEWRFPIIFLVPGILFYLWGIITWPFNVLENLAHSAWEFIAEVFGFDPYPAAAEALATAPDTFDLPPLTIDGWFDEGALADVAIMLEPNVDGFDPLVDAPGAMDIGALLSGELIP